MTALPTRIRQNIRDLVTADTAPLNVKLVDLKKVLGYTINLDPEWPLLWESLKENHPDPATFIPSIVDVVNAWCDAFRRWLEDDRNEENVEKFLDELKKGSQLNLTFEISNKSKRPLTVWRERKNVFIIKLPTNQLPYSNIIMSGFATDLENVFSASPFQGATPTMTPAEGEDPEEWSVLDRKTGAGGQSRGGNLSLTNLDFEDEVLPAVASIPRPEDLTRKPPYWLIVRQEGPRKVTVQASHGPSLQCLEEYLRRWCRGDTTRADRPPIVHIQIQEAAFGLGLLNDTLTLEGQRLREVSAMVVLVFVENVLGYTQITTSVAAGAVWEFKRTKGFR